MCVFGHYIFVTGPYASISYSASEGIQRNVWYLWVGFFGRNQLLFLCKPIICVSAIWDNTFGLQNSSTAEKHKWFRKFGVTFIYYFGDKTVWSWRFMRRHDMGMLSALLAHCEGNLPVTNELLEWSVIWSYGVFFYVRLNKVVKNSGEQTVVIWV